MLCITSPLLAQSATPSAVGEVSLVKGVVTAQSSQQPLRILASGSVVYLKDQIETAKNSFVVIKMADGGKITLRPETALLVAVYNQQAGQEAETFKLIKGGLRAISGFIGKTRPAQVKFETRTTTIGIRGTDFILRDCITCQLDEQAAGDKPRVAPGAKSAAGSAGGSMPVVTLIDGSQRRVLSREEVGIIKRAVYFAVLDGGIYAQSGSQRIDIDAVDACFRGEGSDGFHCLLEIPRFLLNDPYFNKQGDEFTLFNIFNNIDEENEVCQIDWK